MPLGSVGKTRWPAVDGVDFREGVGVVDGVDVSGPVLFAVVGDAWLSVGDPFATLILVVIRLFAVHTDDFIVVTVVARAPVVRGAVERRSRLLLLWLRVVAVVVTSGVSRFPIPIRSLSLWTELNSINLMVVFLDGRDCFVGISNLSLIASEFKSSEEGFWLLL